MKSTKIKTITFGLTSGIATIKTLALIQNIQKTTNYKIQIIATTNTLKLFPISYLEKTIKVPIYINTFEPNTTYEDYLENKRPIPHIELAQNTNLLCICPATANIIAKIATGIADDLLSTVALATTAKICLCPAMNSNMWHNPITQKNIQTLQNLDYEIINPEYGQLACGVFGVGRLANIDKIKEKIITLIEKKSVCTKTKPLIGKTVIVTAGGTSEKIDPVRVLTNRSSGKMGVALAEIAYEQGAQVILIKSKTAIKSNIKIQTKKVTTTQDFSDCLKKLAPQANIIIHAAAISDFTIKPSSQKIKSNKSLTLELIPTKKILPFLKKWNPNAIVVGFKAESESNPKKLIEIAYQKGFLANTDFIIANDISSDSQGFEVDTNEVFIIDKYKNISHITLNSKHIIAKKILETIMNKI